ncbi:MAG: mucin9, partial [bacterium]
AGAAVSTATVKPKVDVTAGGSVSASSISLISRLNANDDGSALRTDSGGNALPTADAFSQAIAGSVLAAGAGANATATDAGIAALTLAPDARLTATGNVTLLAVSYSAAQARTSAISASLASAGVSKAAATTNGSTQVALDGDIASAASATITAASTAAAVADAAAIAAGAVNAGVAQADAAVGRSVSVAVGAGAALKVTGALTVEGSADNHADANTGGGTGGVLSATAMLPTATVSGRTAVQFDGDVLGAASVTLRSEAANVADAGASVVNVAVAGGAGAKAIATVSDDADIDVAVGPTAELATSGALLVQARSHGNEASAVVTGGAGGLISTGVVFSQAIVGGGVRASFDGTVASASSVTVEADGSNLADADTHVVAIGALTISTAGTEARVGAAGDAEAALGSGASISTSGQLRVAATADNRALAFSDAGTGGVGAVSVRKPEATIEAGTLARLDGDVTAATAITVEADATNLADARSEVVSVGIFFSGAGASAAATITSGVDVRAALGASADITVPGATVTVHAAAANNAIARSQNGSGGAISVAVADPTATDAAQTHAELLGNVDALSVNVVAQSDDRADAGLRSSTGGIFAIDHATSSASVGSQVVTTLGGPGSVIVAANDIAAKALATTDADSASRSTGGGAINIRLLTASASTAPLVTTTVGAAARIEAGGEIEISAAHNRLTAPVSDGTFNAGSGVDTSNAVGGNAISFSLPHGLSTGDVVTYDARGNTAVGGLASGRQYGIIVPTGSTTVVQLGGLFDGAIVDTASDEIVFGSPHAFQTGDTVFYFAPSGSTPIPGLTSGTRYEVLRIDGERIKLRVPGASLPSLTIPGSSITTDTITAANSFGPNDPITYHAPGPAATFTSALVDAKV